MIKHPPVLKGLDEFALVESAGTEKLTPDCRAALYAAKIRNDGTRRARHVDAEEEWVVILSRDELTVQFWLRAPARGWTPG